MSIKEPFLQKSSNIYMQNKLLVGILIFIALSSAYDSYQISKIRQTKETHIIPYGDVEPYILRFADANYPYVRDMSKYIIWLYSNHDALTVKSQYSILLGLFHPQSLPRYQKKLNDMSLDYSKYVNISHIGNVSVTNPISVLENTITINYKQSRITGTTVQAPISKQLIVKYVIESGRFWILEMSEKELVDELNKEQ